MARFRIYSRPGCHLCEEMREELLPLLRGRAEIDHIDIETDARLREKYSTRIPVLEFEGQVICQYRLDRAALTAILVGISEGS